MATLPSPTQVAGNHSAIYEAYYNVVDPKGIGTIGGMEAARFLKRSGLSDVILSKIWDLSDPGGRGCLDKAGMFVALKLVALVQNGRDLTIANATMDVPPPKMGDIPLPKPVKPPPPTNTPLITSLPPSAVDWTVKPGEREKYDKLFDSLQPINGLIPGNKSKRENNEIAKRGPIDLLTDDSPDDMTDVVPSERVVTKGYKQHLFEQEMECCYCGKVQVKNVLLESKLPFDTLGKIWDLADQDKDGMLDRHEFIAAMHLVYKALEKYAIPNSLPPELIPPAKRKGTTPMGPLSNLDGMKPMRPELPPAAPMPTAAPPPLPSSVPPPMVPPAVKPPLPVVQQQPVQPTPAVPWVVTPEEKAKSDALFIKSDVDKDGFVTGQEIKDVFLQSGVPQLMLAQIWALCDIKQCGKLNNEQFALAMWFVARALQGKDPPTTLTPEMVPPSFRTTKPSEAPVENNNTKYSNPELDMISKDIQELGREKLMLETEIAQKEADIKIKSGEIKSLQSELDTLAATLKQLENQKGEAQKRLNDLKTQRSEVDDEMESVDRELDVEQEKVDKLRAQAAEQAETVAVQEAELNSKKEQLEGLRQEELRLEQERTESLQRLEGLASNLQETQLTISQAKALITQLEEQTRQMNDAIQACDKAIDAGDPALVPDTLLKISPEFRDPQYIRVGVVSNGDFKRDDISQNDAFVSQNNAVNSSSGFADDPFQNDPFKNSSDAFSSNDPFNAAFSKPNDGFTSDPFGSSFTNTNTSKTDPFDAFGDSNQKPEATPEPDKDPFGCDPFAVLHAPTRDGAPPGRPVSPSPALPPKKSKQPPPRPAPPRPTLPPAKKGGQPDPFGMPASDAFASNAGFADFSDFDAKFSTKPTAKLAVPTPAVPTPRMTIATARAAIVMASIKGHSNNNNNNNNSSNIKGTSNNNNSNNSKGLDFTCDPFRDYRYEDPFNIQFDDEPSDVDSKSAGSLDALSFGKDASTGGDSGVVDGPDGDQDKFDPFGLNNGRKSVPLPASDPFVGAGGRSSVPPIKMELVSEDQQLAWAAQESLRLEEDRRKRQLQEQADLELAISLSKAEK